MKVFKFSIFFASLLLLIFSCNKDQSVVEDQAKNDHFYPRIFNDLDLFPSTSSVIAEGDTVSFTGMQYSPADKIRISWTVNGIEKSTDKNFFFVGGSAGDYAVQLNVISGDDTAYRKTEILVNSRKYTHKTYTLISMAYLNDTATASSVDWSKVTHVTYKGGFVDALGSLDLSSANENQRALRLTANGHLHGVPVLLGISGELSEDGWAVYPSNNLGSVLADPVKRKLLVDSTKAAIDRLKMDGVDIMMTDINSTTAQINAAIAGIAPFVHELKTALGDTTLVTVTATTNYYYSRYPDLSEADWVNIHAFEDELHVGPDAPLGLSSSYDYMVEAANNWKAKLDAKKIVIGAPAMGLHYTAVNDNGNNLGWTSYHYMPYKDILSIDADAYDKTFIPYDKGLYFNGVPLIQQKASFAKSGGFAGMYLWPANWDTTGPHSLMAAIYNSFY